MTFSLYIGFLAYEGMEVFGSVISSYGEINLSDLWEFVEAWLIMIAY